jgi:16S rRNA C967 or C1407 C5-methylase (RsmB/RsmF family)
VLYATCSLEPAENARQAEWLRRRGGLTPVAERQRFPEGRPGDPASSYVDGGFHSVASRG